MERIGEGEEREGEGDTRRHFDTIAFARPQLVISKNLPIRIIHNNMWNIFIISIKREKESEEREEGGRERRREMREVREAGRER